MRDDSPEVSQKPVELPPGAAIDMTVFAQLLSAVQQTGLNLNADAIASARDRDFREGRYQRAFDVIEGISVQLQSAASRRQGDLRRQETQYKSGALKMSPKEWMLRQQRETAQSQRIDRARRHFARVLDALNALRAAQDAAPKPESPAVEEGEPADPTP
jgi:hypothetical protein